MQLTLHRALAGALLAGLTTAGGLWPTAQAQSFANDDVSRVTAAEATMTPHPYTPQQSLGDVIFDNGDIKTGTTTSSGVAVPTPGYEWSEVQNDAGNLTESNTSAGSTCTLSGTIGFRLADDFTVPAGETWTIDAVTTYGYQTGFAGAISPVLTATLRIWDGPPGGGGSVIFGDETTDRRGASVEHNAYRVFNTSVPPPGSAPGTTRRVWATDINVAPALALTAGTYWVDWQYGVASGVMFCPSVTIVGDRGLDGWNGRQRTTMPEGWVVALDTGNPASAPDVPQDFPFELHGSTGGGGGPITFPSTDTPIAIPDGNTTGINSVITVPPGGPTIGDLDIAFDLTHTWVGDIRAQVTFGATTVAFFDRPGVPTSTFGCSGNDADIIADDEGTDGSLENDCVNVDASPAYIVGGRYTPNSPLSVYDGVSSVGAWTLNVSDHATPDPGTLNSWALMITPAGGTVVNTYPSTDTPIAIPDNVPTGIFSTIVIPPNGNEVVDVDVDLNITHTWVGDLRISLTKEATTSQIVDRPGALPPPGAGCSGNDMNLVLNDEGTDGTVNSCISIANPGQAYPVIDGHYIPDAPLSAFDGMDVGGSWVLNVSDNAGLDIGTLQSWALIITEDVGTAGPGGPENAEASLRVLPNPMNASGTVELTVPTSQDVRVAVYDMLGREVMVLFEGSMAASQRALISVAAGRLDAGVYVVRAIGDDFQTTQRVTIAR